mmetsp:Transcript_69205/g.114714  ORF Transcript_69205/g.114714 Transcript_69205/m.114714 type:complete len:291 (-) Transcript_69205:81-953(-)
MSIDAYDVLNVDPTADPEEIKKSYKRMSLREHPDKALANGRSEKEQNEKFHELKMAWDILQDADRRKIYDTFGLDLGEERPEMEVWNIGLNTLLAPMGGFTCKTAAVRLAVWLLDFRWLSWLLLLIGIGCLVVYVANMNFQGKSLQQSEAFMSLGLIVGVVDIVIILLWIHPLLGDTVAVIYLLSEVVGVPLLVDNWKIMVACPVIGFFIAWFLRGWWYYVLGLEVILAIIMLAALTVAAGIMRLWIDGVQGQRGEKILKWRLDMRKERKKLQDEVADLKRKLQMRTDGR